MIKVAEIVCPEKRQAFANVSLRSTVCCFRISELSADLNSQLNNKVKSFVAFSVAIDESTDITDIAQLVIFIRRVETLTIMEDFLELVPVTDTTTADDLFCSIVRALDKIKVDWSHSHAVGLSTDVRHQNSKFKLQMEMFLDFSLYFAPGGIVLQVLKYKLHLGGGCLDC